MVAENYKILISKQIISEELILFTSQVNTLKKAEVNLTHTLINNKEENANGESHK
jgi:hypothetical protein